MRKTYLALTLLLAAPLAAAQEAAAPTAAKGPRLAVGGAVVRSCFLELTGVLEQGREVCRPR